MKLHAQREQLALQVEVAGGVGCGEVLAHDAYAHRPRGLARGQRPQRVEPAALRLGDVALAGGLAHVGEVALACALERPRLHLEPGVGQVEVVRLVQALDHLERGQHVAHAVRHRHVRVHLLLADGDVLGQRLVCHRGEIQHLELVAQIAQDGLLQLAVVAQPARARELHEHDRAQLKRLDVVAQDVLERRAHHVTRMARPQLDGAPRGLREGDEISVQHMLHEELERDVVVAVAEERHARAGVAVALGRPFAAGLGRQQLERASSAVSQHHASAAHLVGGARVADSAQRVHAFAAVRVVGRAVRLLVRRRRHGRSLLSPGSAGCQRSSPCASPTRRCRFGRRW